MAVKELPVRQRGVCCGVEIGAEFAQLKQTAEILKALADSTRLGMVAALWRAKEPVCICDFTAAFELTQPTISHHMAKLKDAGLVESRKRGVWVYYRLVDNLPTGLRRLIAAAVDAA